MALYKVVNGVRIEMTPQEEAAFELSRAPSLPELKRTLRAAVRAKRIACESAGTTLGQNTIETTPEFRQQLRELRDWLADNSGQQVPVRLANGRVVRVNAAQLNAAAQAIMAHVRACLEAEATHLEAIADLADVAAAKAYDVSTGWPA